VAELRLIRSAQPLPLTSPNGVVGSGATSSRSLSMLIDTPPHVSTWSPRYCLIRRCGGQYASGIAGSDTVATLSHRAKSSTSGCTCEPDRYTATWPATPEAMLL
jgi:hypothetical protein